MTTTLKLKTSSSPINDQRREKIEEIPRFGIPTNFDKNQSLNINPCRLSKNLTVGIPLVLDAMYHGGVSVSKEQNQRVTKLIIIETKPRFSGTFYELPDLVHVGQVWYLFLVFCYTGLHKFNVKRENLKPLFVLNLIG